VAVVAVILVSLVVFIPIIVGDHTDQPIAPTGGVSQPSNASDDPTVPPALRRALREIARREAAQRYCDAHPEETSSELCVNGA
jgi:hypothetical protein